jgi:two-component system chemotaxis sensor kinase CheA
LEHRPEDKALVSALFRSAHTLKGNSRSVGWEEFSHCCHAFEDLLEGVRAGRIHPGPVLVTALLTALDDLRLDIQEEGQSGHLSDTRSRLRSLTGEAVQEHSMTASTDTDSDSAGRPARETIRVEVEKLDRLITLAGEISIARGRMNEALARQSGGLKGLRETHSESDQLHIDMQELVMRLRMTPIGPLFREQLRTARDVASSCGKQVEVGIEGGDVEVDLKVIGLLRSPVNHLIRNAVMHGIETPEARRAAGKPEVGHIRINAIHQAGEIVIEIGDDGRGLDREAVLERARASGIAVDDETRENSWQDLIFRPGFSTSKEVSEHAGRGVGLDIVKRNIETLRGSVSAHASGQGGAGFTLRMPLTLAIIDGFRVQAGGNFYVAPMENVVECIDLESELTSDAESGVAEFRGQPLPFVRLSRLYGGTIPRRRREGLVVVRSGTQRAGLVVDALLGSTQTVIKPLSRGLRRVDGIAGVSILGNGAMAFVLDVPGLIRNSTPNAA